MKYLYILFVIGFVISCKPRSEKAKFTEGLSTEGFRKMNFYNQDGDLLLYNILNPIENDSMDSYPLLLFLHGAGERGNDNESQLNNIASIFAKDSIRKAHPSFVVFPQCPEDQRWGSVDVVDGRWVANAEKEATVPMVSVMGLLDKMIDELPIDTNRIYLSGLSMGGYGTFDLLYRRPHTFAAAVPICGGGDEDVVSAYAHVPIKIFHGTKDSVVPVDYSRNIYKALRAARANNVEYIEYPEGTHNVWDKAYSEPNIIDWIYRQKK